MTSINDKLFINLKILSKIQKNGRISRSCDGIISLEQESFYQSLKRFISSDSRKQSILEINSIIVETIDTLNSIVNSKYMDKKFNTTNEYYKNCENINSILNEFKNARIGIVNLQFTYKLDANIASQLDIIILKMNSAIKDFQHKIDYFNSYLPESFKDPIKEQAIYINPLQYSIPQRNSFTEQIEQVERNSFTEQSRSSFTDQVEDKNQEMYNENDFELNMDSLV
jgi:hypothetical protein